MTREDAIHIVDVAFDIPPAVRRCGDDRTYHEEEIREAKRMAIKALEQEPCGDAISRQAVLDILDDMGKDYVKEHDFIKANGVAWVKVQRLSSVSTEREVLMEIM